MRKRIIILLALGLGLVTGTVTLAAPESNFSIPWWTVDGGGGVSSGGAYTLSGTVGQPDAGLHSGGVYTLDGGYWGGATAQVYSVYLPLIRR